MIVSSLEYCAKVTIGRLLVNDVAGRLVLQNQIENDSRFDILLETILIELVKNGADAVTDELLVLLLSGKIRMKKLILEGCVNVTINGLSAALDNQPYIETLDVSKCSKLTVSSLGDIFAHKLPHLETLSLESCEMLTDEIVKDIMTKCIHLINLNLSCNQMLTDQLFDFSEEDKCTLDICQLTRIDLSGCQGISSTSVRHMLSLFGSTLQSINISWTKIDCTALVYLSGYSLSSAVYVATSSNAEMPFSVAELEASQEFEFRVTKKQTCDKIQNLLGTVAVATSEDGSQKSSSLSMYRSLPTESEMNNENGSVDVRLNRTCEKDAIVNQQMSLKDHLLIQKNTVDPSQTASAATEAADICKNILNMTNRHTFYRNENIYCALCNRSENLGLKRAHSYNCIDENDIAIYRRKIKNKLVGIYNTRLSRSSCNLQESTPLHQRTTITFNESFPMPRHAFLGQDRNTSNTISEECSTCPIAYTGQNSSSCDYQVVATISPSLKKFSESKNGAGTDTDADTLPLSAKVANGNSGVCSGLAAQNEDFDKKTSLQSEASKTDGNRLGASNYELEMSKIGEMSSLLSSQAEFYKPRQMFVCQITELDISQIKFYDVNVGIKCLTMFVTSNHQLRSLSISWQGLTDSLLDVVVRNEPNLMKISLAECECLSNSGITSLGQHCKRLVDLDLQGVPFISDKGLVKVLAHGILSELSLAECAVTDLTLKNIAKFCFASIRKLNFSWCENITNEGLIRLLEVCSGLESLNLRQCEVSTQAVEALTCFSGSISYLGLCSIQDLTDKLSCPLLQSLKDLTFIDLSWNCLLTDETLSTLMTSCIMLREVVLAGLKRISSRTFLPIISGLSEWKRRREFIRNRLKKKVHANTRDIGAQEILDEEFYLPYRSLHYAPNLCKIDLSFSDKVNDTHLAEIVSVCRGTLAIDDYYSMPIKPRWDATVEKQ